MNLSAHQCIVNLHIQGCLAQGQSAEYVMKVQNLIFFSYIHLLHVDHPLCGLFWDLPTLEIFGPKRDEVTGEGKKLHNEELSDPYSLPNIVRVVKSRKMRWARHVARMGEGRGVHRVLVGKPEGKRLLGRPRCRWEDNIKRDLQEVGGGCGDWMELAQDRDRWQALVSMVENFQVP